MYGEGVRGATGLLNKKLFLLNKFFEKKNYGVVEITSGGGS
jgi:hypothetical protein